MFTGMLINLHVGKAPGAMSRTRMEHMQDLSFQKY